MSSNSTRKLLWFEISKMLIAVLKNKFSVLFIIIFGTLSFPWIVPYGFPREPCPVSAYFSCTWPHLSSAVFTCIGALGTPSRTGPSLESIYRVSLTVDLCEG